MLKTPLGPVRITDENGHEPSISVRKVEERTYPTRDVNAIYRLSVEIPPLTEIVEVLCFLDAPLKGDVESGEILEAIAFYDSGYKLTIGAEAEFGCCRDHDYLPDGEYTENGIRLLIPKSDEATTVVFGVAWITPVTEDNETQTWFAADPGLDAHRNPTTELNDDILAMAGRAIGGEID